MRPYSIYARERYGDFSTRYADYSAGTHRWTFRVYAASIEHAMYLAANGRFAPNGWLAGIRRIEFAWWWHRSMPEPGDITLAPYLATDVLVQTHSEERSQ